MFKRTNINLAFSLVELLIVIVIVGVLSAIAIPSYGRYKTNVKIQAIMGSANNSKKIIETKIVKNLSTWGASAPQVSNPNEFVSEINVNTGSVHYSDGRVEYKIELKITINDNQLCKDTWTPTGVCKLVMIPQYINDKVSWICGASELISERGNLCKYLPKNCQNNCDTTPPPPQMSCLDGLSAGYTCTCPGHTDPVISGARTLPADRTCPPPP